MKSILLTEKDIRNLINKIINEVYRPGWSVNPADANEMLDQFVQAYETEGPNGQKANQIYGDIWGFAMTALKPKVARILGSRFDSFYYPDAVDRQFVDKKTDTMKIIYDDHKAGNDTMYNLARYIANKLKDILDKNANRDSHHVMAMDTRVNAGTDNERDIMDRLSNEVVDDEEQMDLLEKMKLYLQSYSNEMPPYIKNILQNIITGIENMDPNVKEEIMSMNLTDNKMQQMILMTALSSADNDSQNTIPYPEVKEIIAKYRLYALNSMAQRGLGDPRTLQASPKDIKNAIADRNPSGVLVLKTAAGEEKEYAVNDVMVAINTLINTRKKLSDLRKWFNEHDLDFETLAQNARGIAENRKRVIRLTENDVKHIIKESVKKIMRGYLK